MGNGNKLITPSLTLRDNGRSVLKCVPLQDRYGNSVLIRASYSICSKYFGGPLQDWGGD